MQEMYQDFEEGEDWELPDERDPFTESDSTEIMIGCVEVYLESIGYMVCECTCCSKKLWLQLVTERIQWSERTQLLAVVSYALFSLIQEKYLQVYKQAVAYIALMFFINPGQS